MVEITLTKDNFENEVIGSDKPVLVDFWAVWCGPCRMLSPIIKEIADELDGKVKVGKVNVDEESELSVKFHIVSIPTLIVFKDGKVSKTAVGYMTKEEVMDLLK